MALFLRQEIEDRPELKNILSRGRPTGNTSPATTVELTRTGTYKLLGLHLSVTYSFIELTICMCIKCMYVHTYIIMFDYICRYLMYVCIYVCMYVIPIIHQHMHLF